MNNGCIVRPKKAVLAMRGGSLRSMKPQRQARYNTESLGNIYAFTMSDNVTQESGIGGLVNSVQASSEQFASFYAFNTTTTEWISNSAGSPVSSWLRINLNFPIVVRAIAITAGGNATICPKSWTWEGSNDGSTWDVLDTRANVANWVDTERRYYTFLNGSAYLSYRINITNVENTGFGTGYTAIDFLQLYD